MKEKLKVLWNKIIDTLFGFISKSLEFAYGLFVKFFEIIFGLLEGLRAQISTANGAIIFASILFILYDVYKRGELGVIRFLVTTTTDAVTAIITALQLTGGQLFVIIIGALIFAAYKKGVLK
jgi:hypothetical protein